ncbi:MAG: Asp-tRNA(Asn)/Glu-tRNA(Gln) amidotransferase subunit GatA [Anaerolineae bacterium]|nr:Asp-tRNA(Asn)/Glu-tRNA(Gln) amidotransferase subunit GatA [Anaerolineae bacterium]
MLNQLTLSEAREKLDRGEITSVELTQAHLDHIRSHDDEIKAYLTVTEEKALHMAAEADKRLQVGEKTPLLGIPLAVKDVLCTEGVQTTCASRLLEGFQPPYNGTAVQKLFDAGAVMLGKTNTDEFAMGSSTENSGFFTTRNPWDTTRVPGGSSGGSAAAVAAHMAVGGLGTDTGGSVRAPGAFCGIVALKPSYGLVSRYGLIAFASSLDSIGCFGRRVGDVADILQAMAGYDEKDSTSYRADMPDYKSQLQAGVKGLRIGLPKEYFIEGVQPATQKAVHAAIDHLASLGAEIIEVSLPHTEYALPTYYLVATAEASANLARYDGVRYGVRQSSGDGLWPMYKATRGHGFGPEVKRRIMLGTFVLSAGYYDAYYLKAQKVRTLIKDDFEKAFEQVDVIAAPTMPSTAFKIGEKSQDPLQMYLTDVFTLPSSLAGICGLTVPCGFDENRLPIGLQILGPFMQEARILQVAAAYEQSTEWHRHEPAPV